MEKVTAIFRNFLMILISSIRVFLQHHQLTSLNYSAVSEKVEHVKITVKKFEKLGELK